MPLKVVYQRAAAGEWVGSKSRSKASSIQKKTQWSRLLWCTNEPSENFGNFFRDVDDDDTLEGGHQQQQSSHNVIHVQQQ